MTVLTLMYLALLFAGGSGFAFGLVAGGKLDDFSGPSVVVAGGGLAMLLVGVTVVLDRWLWCL